MSEEYKNTSREGLIDMLEESEDLRREAAAELAALRARAEELKKALDKSNKYLAETLAYAKFPNHAYSLTVSNIERRIRHNNDILNQQS